MSPKQARVVEFFRTAIGTYVVRDLESLRIVKTLPQNRDTIGWCAVPLAQTLFAVLDVLGYLTRPEPNASKNETMKNIMALVSDSSLFPADYADHSKVLVTQFRHGVIHQFFPKAAGIGRFDESKPLLIDYPGGTSLNVDRLEKDTLIAIQRLKCRVSLPESDALCVQMSNRLDQLATEDWNDFPAV